MNSHANNAPLDSTTEAHGPLANTTAEATPSDQPASLDIIAYQKRVRKEFLNATSRSKRELLAPFLDQNSLASFFNIAIEDGVLEIVQVLMEHNPYCQYLLEQPNANGTPLNRAAEKNYRGIVLYLLSKGADGSFLLGKHLLHNAAQNGDLELVQALVENVIHRAYIENAGTNDPSFKWYVQTLSSLFQLKDANGNTPLLLAATNDHHSEVVSYLVGKGADPIEALNLAFVSHRYKIVAAIIRTGRVDITKTHIKHNDFNYRVLSLLHKAVVNGDLAMVQALIEGNPHFDPQNPAQLIDQRDNTGQTPLLWAVFLGHHHIVEYLLKKGAHPNARPNDEILLGKPRPRKSILEHAFDRNRIKIVALLCQTGKADIKQRRADKNSPSFIQQAANDGNLDMLKALIENNPNFDEQTIAELLNQKDKEGKTPLMWATSKLPLTKKHEAVVAYLLTKGAKFDIANPVSKPLDPFEPKGAFSPLEDLTQYPGITKPMTSNHLLEILNPGTGPNKPLAVSKKDPVSVDLPLNHLELDPEDNDHGALIPADLSHHDDHSARIKPSAIENNGPPVAPGPEQTLSLFDKHVMNRIDQIMKQICEQINKRGGYLTFWGEEHDKQRYVLAAYNHCVESYKDNNLETTLQKFKIFLACCMQNKNGPGFFNRSNKTKTGMDAIAFLNTDLENDLVNNYILEKITKIKDCKRVNYKQVANGLCEDLLLRSTTELIFNKAPINEIEAHKAKLSITAFSLKR